MADEKKVPLPKQEIITIEPQLGGWISDFIGSAIPNEGQPGQYKYSYGMSAMRSGKGGHIGPAEIFNNFTLTDASHYFNSLPRSLDIDTSQVPNTEWYMLGGLSGTAPRLVMAQSGAVTGFHDISAINNFTTIPSTGTGFWGEDVLFYTGTLSNATVRMILYSWNDSGTGAVGFYDIDTASFVSDDFFSTTYFSGKARPTVGVPHRMCVGPDKIVYMTNGEFLASYDCTTDQAGANGTYNPQALDFGLGWVSVDVQPYGQSYTATAIVKTGTGYVKPTATSEACEARVVLWNGSDLDFSQLYLLDDWYVNSIKIVDGVFYAFTQGKSGTTKVKVLNIFLNKFETVWEAPTSVVGNAPFYNQVEWFNDMIQWAGDGTTNMVFALQQTQTGFALHTPYYLHDGNGTVPFQHIGLLKNVSSNILYAGVNRATGSTYGVAGAYGDGTSNGFIVGSKTTAGALTHMSRLIQFPYRCTVRKVKAFFSQFGASSSATVSLVKGRTNYSNNSGAIGSDVLNWNISSTTHPKAATLLTASTSENPATPSTIPDVTEAWLNVQPTNSSVSATPPVVRRIEITIEAVEKP